jgi:hypothetical protein
MTMNSEARKRSEGQGPVPHPSQDMADRKAWDDSALIPPRKDYAIREERGLSAVGRAAQRAVPDVAGRDLIKDPDVRKSVDEFFGSGAEIGKKLETPEALISLDGWWEVTSSSDLAAFKAKAAEYGSDGGDLREIGRALCQMLDWEVTPDQEWIYIELGIAFYALGKIQRLFESFKGHRIGSDDSWHDLEVYAKMARMVRARGRLG